MLSVIPITLIVLILSRTAVPLTGLQTGQFLLGAFLIIIGLTIFLIGVDNGITPIGNEMGNSLARTNNLTIVAVAGLILGFFISVAEPDLHILAAQVELASEALIGKNALVIVVSVGVGVLISLGLLRILKEWKLKNFLTIVYGLIGFFGLFASEHFLAIAFDASGSTTGALTVPFMLALAVGVSHVKSKTSKNDADGFGLVGIASAGAIIAVLAMSVLSNTGEVAGDTLVVELPEDGLASLLLAQFGKQAADSAFALLPIVLIFLISQKLLFKLSKKGFRRISIGLIYAYIGLVLFLTGVNAGFMDVGRLIGETLATLHSPLLLIAVAFLIGMVTILAEPAVYVLTKQIEDVTSGYVPRKLVMISLCLGVGAAVALSMVRIMIPSLRLWHFLLPGYLISLTLSHIVPDLFVGIAYDSGGVASGPMTATFILALAQGAASATPTANVLVDGFGVIAMVAMTPVLALQLLGLGFMIKGRKKGLTVKVTGKPAETVLPEVTVPTEGGDAK
jgi:hypothetical protein